MNVTPSQALQAEVALLGAILLDGSVIAQVAETLSPEDLYREPNAQIYPGGPEALP